MSTPIDSLELQLISNSSDAVKGLNTLSNTLGKFGKSVSSATTINNAHAKSYVNIYAKIKVWSMALKMGIATISKFITASSDYVENVNLFTVSMGEYAEEAKKYAEEVGDIMGIDPGEWMRNQGVFMTLAKGFGVAGDRANTMSKNLTQLGYDISSFFNISTEDAMQKLQSGIAGELEPLRRIGYDLSQARLELEAYNLGITKKVSEMTQAEKAELRYYAIMTQVTDAQGDMARTLDAPANQLRILKAQVTQATRAIGNLFIPILNKVLPVANAVLQVIRSLADTIASLFGITLTTVDFDSASDGANGLSDGLEDAAKNAKKLKNYTAGFDELNVLSTKDESEDGLGGGFSFELPEYDFISEATQTKVNEIVEKMKEWLGLTEDINSWSDLLDTRLGTILKVVGEIGIAILAWKVTDGFLNSLALMKTLLASPTYSIVIGATIAIVGLTLAFDGMENAIQEGLNGLNFTEILGGSMLTTVGAGLLGSKIATWLGTAFASPKIPFALAHIGKNLGLATSGAVGAALGGAIAGIVVGIPMYITGIYDAITKGIDWLSATLIGVGATAAGAGIGAIIGALGGPIGAGIGALIGLAVGAITDLVILAVQNWDAIAEFFVNMWENICNFFAPVGEWFNTYVIQPVANFFEGLTTRIGQFFKGCWIIIQAVWKIVSTWFNDNVIKPLVDFFRGVWEDVSKFFSDLWTDICKIWEPVGAWFDEHIITPVKEAFDKACKKIGEFFSALWLGIRQGVASAMNGVIGAIEGAINWVIGGINNLISGFNDLVQWAADIIGEDWGGVSLIQEVHFQRVVVPEYADGGFPEQGQMFIAREAGAEMVGSIGRRTAVANNDQIVAGIANGVASANSESNGLLREQNELLRALLAKETGVYFDGKRVTQVVEKRQRERGRPIVTGGAY